MYHSTLGWRVIKKKRLLLLKGAFYHELVLNASVPGRFHNEFVLGGFRCATGHCKRKSHGVKVDIFEI